jgi:hypothetical protein
MRYSAAEDQLWYKHGRTVLHPKDAFDDAIRNGMDEEGKYHYMYMYSSETSMRDTTECIGTSGKRVNQTSMEFHTTTTSPMKEDIKWQHQPICMR